MDRKAVVHLLPSETLGSRDIQKALGRKAQKPVRQARRSIRKDQSRRQERVVLWRLRKQRIQVWRDFK